MPLSNLCCISKQKKSARSHTVSCESECPKHCRLRPHTRVVSPLSAFGSCQVSCVGSHPGLGRLMSEPKPEPTPEPAEPHKGTTQEPQNLQNHPEPMEMETPEPEPLRAIQEATQEPQPELAPEPPEHPEPARNSHQELHRTFGLRP